MFHQKDYTFTVARIFDVEVALVVSRVSLFFPPGNIPLRYQREPAVEVLKNV